MPLIEYKWRIQSTPSGTPLNKIDPVIHRWKSWVLVFFLIADSGIKVSTRSIQIQKIGGDIQRWQCQRHIYKMHQIFNEVNMIGKFLFANTRSYTTHSICKIFQVFKVHSTFSTQVCSECWWRSKRNVWNCL